MTHIRLVLLVAMIALCSTLMYSRETGFRMAPLFTDNMVLQQKSEVPVWGNGTPGTMIQLRTAWGAEAAAPVRPDGSWRVAVRTPAAGGPYQIAIRHDDTTLTLQNVMIGEVWLCSGQSNMEMPLVGWPPNDTIMHASVEIPNAAMPDVRFFTVRRAFSAVPESTCSGSWSECSPATAPSFSATAYFFGKKLHESLRVPIGLIHSSWGGTAVESWISASCLSRIPQYDTTLVKVRAAADSMGSLRAWQQQFRVIGMQGRAGAAKWHGLAFDDSTCALPAFNDSLWHDMRLPTVWESTGMGEFDGTVWFRRKIQIPAAWLHKNLVLELGPIDDMDITYVNGVSVGSHESEGMWKVDRVYRVPGTLVDTSILQVAVRVIDYQGNGGIFGDESAMCIHPDSGEGRVPLAGAWKFLPVAEYQSESFIVFGAVGERFFTRPKIGMYSAYMPTALYNGMIAPLAPFAIKGVIWYQGESDTKHPALYRQLFPLMIENWRSAFRDENMPFYYVQIAPYEYDSTTASEYLREAQLAALEVPNTGMAVTLDIGNPRNIHPSNKLDVGDRLARWALAKTYGKRVPYCGPMVASVKSYRNRIEILFDHAEKGLMLKAEGPGNGFLIAGKDRVFREASVRVRGSRLILSHPEISNPQAVRYAFTNTSQATLFNKDGLPSPSFRTDAWEP